MKAKWLALGLGLIGGAAWAGFRPWTENQTAAGRTAPSTDATEGLSLDRVVAYQVTVCAETGRTLSGAGTLDAYWYNPTLLKWVKNPGLALSVTASAVRCMTFPQSTVGSPQGRVLYAANGVTISGGTTVDVRVDSFYR